MSFDNIKMNFARQLTSEGKQSMHELAQRHGVSVDAVETLLFALRAGGGTLAQFSHPELGGNGQWMRGGMTMVGDMFNHKLKATVDDLCSELSSLLSAKSLFVPPPDNEPDAMGSSGNAWWPAELGSPSSTGGQNEARYAYFPQRRRLAIIGNGKVTVYDTLDHQIRGVQQQQGRGLGSLEFTSQLGTFTIEKLPLAGSESKEPPADSSPVPTRERHSPQHADPPPASVESHDVLKTLERLGDLHRKGLLTDDEFKAKKGDLLSRL